MFSTTAVLRFIMIGIREYVSRSYSVLGVIWSSLNSENEEHTRNDEKGFPNFMKFVKSYRSECRTDNLVSYELVGVCK